MVVGLILAILGVLIHPISIFAWLIGFLGFLTLPLLGRSTGFKGLANFHLWLAGFLLQRAAIVVTEHGDLLLKSMDFDDLGVETITFNDDTKEFEDPGATLHNWLGIPFALADEKHGFLFDPRFAAIAKRKADAEERDEWSYPATEQEWEDHGVQEWKRGVFELPKNHELTTLEYARKLVHGGERAEFPERIKQFYIHSRSHLQDGSNTSRYIFLIAAMIVPFAALWFIKSQFGGAATGGTIVSSLLVIAGLKQVNWKRGILAMLLLIPIVGIYTAIFLFFGPLLGVAAMVMTVLGFTFLPAMIAFSGIIGLNIETIARQLFKLGLIAYDEPVLEWGPKGYSLREFAHLDDAQADDTSWYTLCGSKFGFTYDPDPDHWGAAHMSKDDIKSVSEAVPDGGRSAQDTITESNILGKYRRLPEMARAGGKLRGFAPKRLKNRMYYVHTGIAMARFKGAANGEKSQNRYMWAKDEFGEDIGLADKTYMYLMVGSAAVSFFAGIGVFWL